MGNYCNIIAHITNNEGQEVESKLFADLLDFHNGNRELTKKDYYAATDQEFLDSITDDVTFDENGEITLHSLIKVANLDPQGDKLIEKLNRDIKSGVYDYAEGLQIAREFNRSEYGDKFLAVLSKSENGKYHLQVVHNTAENQTAFEEVLKEQETQTLIIDTLNEVGVRVDFTDKKSQYKGKFSTASPTQAANGMYNLITLSRGEGTNEDTLKEEAAHFAIAALHDTTQVSRLIDLCADAELVKRLGLFSEEEVSLGANDNKYEAAGRLLANYFNGKNVHGYGGFLNTVKNFIFNIFKKISPNSFLTKRMEASILAKSIANEFFAGKADLNTALNNPMTLHSIDYTSDVVKSITKAKATIKGLRNWIYNADTTLYRAIMDREEIQKVLNADLDSDFDLDYNTAGFLLQEMVSVIVEEMDNVYSAYLDIISQCNPNEYNEDAYKAVYTLVGFSNALSQIQVALDFLIENNTSLANNLDSISSEGFLNLSGSRVAITGLSTIQASVKDAAIDEARKIGAEFLTEVMGSDMLHIRGKLNIGWNRLTIINEDVSASDLITNIREHDSTIGRLFRLPTKLKDTAVSFLRKYMKDTNRSINSLIEAEFDGKMKTIETLAKEAGYSDDFSDFIEVDDDGKSRGNFISECLTWKYEDLRAEIVSEIVKECREYINDHKSEFPTKRSETIYINKAIEESTKLQEFESASWIEGDNGIKKLNPEYEDEDGNKVYVNEQYRALKEKADGGDIDALRKLKLLNAILDYKNFVDSFLTDASGRPLGKPNRIPQMSFRKHLFKKFDMKDMVHGGLSDSDAEIEIGAESSNSYANELAVLNDSFVQLPVYGVKRVSKPSNNIIRSLKLYSVMAARHYTLQRSMNRLYVVKHALQNRKASEGQQEEAKLAQAYNSILDESLNKLYFGEANPYMTDAKRRAKNFLSRVANAVQSIFLTGTIWLSLKSMVSNYLQSTTNYLRNSFVSKHYGFIGFTLNRIKNTYFRFGPWRRKDKMILYHVSGVHNRRILWEDLREDPLIEKYFINGPMEFYALGDSIGQESVFLSMLDHYNGSDADETVGKILKKFGYETVEEYLQNTSYYFVDRDTSERGKTRRLKNIYKFSDKKHQSRISNLKDFLSKVDSAINENEKSRALGTDIYIELSDLLSTSEDSELFIEALKQSGISTTRKDGTLKTLYEIQKEVKDVVDKMTKQEGMYLSEAFLKRKEDTAKYLFLQSFLTKVKEAIKENEGPEAIAYGIQRSLVDLLPDTTYTDSVMEVLNLVGININNEDGSFISLSEIQDKIKEAIDNMIWKEEDIFKLSDSLLSENTEVQGSYFTDVKAAIQEDMRMKSMALYTGYAIGSGNRNFNDGYDVLKGEYVPSKYKTVVFSYLNLIFRRYDSNNGNVERAKKSVGLWLSIAALNTPLLQQFTKIPRVKEVLKKGGYTEEMIKRMFEFGNDLLWWFFTYIIQKMFKKRNPEGIAEQLGYGEGKLLNTKSKFNLLEYDVDEFSYDLVDKIFGEDFMSHILFDYMNEPIINNDKIKDDISKFLTKKNSIHRALKGYSTYEEDTIHAVEAFSSFLAAYSEELINSDSDPLDILKELAPQYDLSDITISEIENCILNPDSSPIKKSGGSKVKTSYVNFLKNTGLEDSEESREYYANPEDSGYSPYAYERYNFSRANDMELLSKHLLSKAFGGMSYDTESAAYKLCGALYYFSRRNMEELTGMTTAYQNLHDISAIKFEIKDAKFVMDLLYDCVTSERGFDDPNFRNALKKSFYDFFLKKAFMETDDYGNIFPPSQEELDNMNSSESKGATGATVQDGFTMSERRSNFLKISR